MAEFKRAFEILKELEFSSCDDILHKNEGEDGYTFMGIYQKAHPSSRIWKEVENYIEMLGYREPLSENEMKEVSRLACNNATMADEASRIYKNEYWLPGKLDKVESQKIANEIFIFGVNAGMTRAIKAAQKIVGVESDGVVGPVTLAALNNFDEDIFDLSFDLEEVKFYKALVAVNDKYKRFEDGWINRSKAV